MSPLCRGGENGTRSGKATHERTRDENDSDSEVVDWRSSPLTVAPQGDDRKRSITTNTAASNPRRFPQGTRHFHSRAQDSRD